MLNGVRPARGMIATVNGGKIDTTFRFQYNPTNVGENLEVDWKFSESPGQFLPVASFKQIGARSTQFQLMLYGRERFDAFSTGNHDVTKDLNTLRLMVSPGPEYGIDAPRSVSPLPVYLVLGSRAIHGVITAISFNHIMFGKNGDPIQSVADIRFRETSSGHVRDAARVDDMRFAAGDSP